MASAVIGALRVNLGIDTAAFTKGMKDANSSLSRLGAQMTKVGAIAGAALGGAAVLFGKAMLDISKGADEMGKLAQKTGIPIEELSGLSYAAKMADVEIATLATGLRKLSINMVEAAADPTSKAAAAFNALGISVLGADGKLKTSSQTLSELANKFAGYRDGAGKAALAVQFLGKTGGDLIPLLNGGGAAITAAAERARSFGLIISQETAAAADTFNDNIEDMGNLLQGFLTNVFARMSGPLARFSGQLLDSAKNTDLLASAAERLVSILAAVTRNILLQIQHLRNFGREVAAVAEIVGSLSFSNSKISIKPLTDAVKKGKEEVEQLETAFDGLIAAPTRVDQAFQDGFGTAQMSLEEFRKSANEFQNMLVDPPQILDPAKVEADAKRVNKALDEVARTRQELGEEFTQLFNETRTPAEAAALEIERLNGLLGKGLDPAIYSRAVENINKELAGTNQLAEDISSTLENGFNSAFRSAMDGAFNFKDFMLNIIKDIAAAAFANSIAGIFGGGKAGGGGGIGGFLSGILGGGASMASSMSPMRMTAPGMSPKAANSNSAVAAPIVLNMVAEESSSFVPRVAQVSGQVVKINNKATPGMLAGRQARFG